RLSAYRLWLQPPIGDGTYSAYRPSTKPIVFRLNGQDVILPPANSIFNIPLSQLNSGFSAAIGAAVKKLNTAVEKALTATPMGELGKNRLVFSYAPAASDPF